MALFKMTKHVDEIRAQPINWTKDIGTATITSSDFTIEAIAGDAAPLTLDSQSDTTRKTTPLFAGGTSGNTYGIENKVTLSDGQELVFEFECEVIDN